jgi:hypothetical protein
LFSDSESGSVEKQDSDDKSEIYAAEGTTTWQKQVTIPDLKLFLREFSVKTNTYSSY